MLSDTEFRQLLHHLDRPWAGYRKVRKGVKKRIRRHMAGLGCSTVDAYLWELAQRPDARAVCEQGLRVTISRFFRDRELWQALESRVLPGLIDRFPAPIRIWSAGCACGEEPYSLAMVWEELGRPARLDLLATDAGGACLARARAGVYNPSSLKRVPDGLRDRYFDSRKGGRQCLIRSGRLTPIRWRQHDLLDPPPEGDPFHLILLRNNLLTYYRGRCLQAALTRIMAALVPGGCLVTGAHERLPVSACRLDRDEGCPWIYRL
ncbi:chemotaxis protein CheR [Desulfosarcina alkanivorans]|uniref:Chemotaxis protein CheR n=1 Tax=Desulfosarcina alkanivorans TaxID=571177 RepID=A0A5K7YL06_9BACT|nr:CheR family methyltransferase [Desulfosarcina alkanivorans]BBO70412.1 chemotaxis protein CheR [Desulfosarcina alkanivorans]